jgi:multidrug efflux pump subunit AcrA (membrane-fusion protein)
MAILDAYPDWKIPGKVRTLIPTADRQKATVKVRVSFDRLDPKILPDMGVKVSFLGDKPAKQANANAVLVPREAVRNENGTAIVFVYTEGQARRRPVRLGELRGSDQEILGGLSAGDEVLVNYPPDLRDAQRVKRK